MARSRKTVAKKTSVPPTVHAQKVKGALRAINILKHYAQYIVQEIVDEMNLTVTAYGKSFTPNALDEWRPKLVNSVLLKLINNGNWALDRPKVLTVARDMTVIAAILSGPTPTVAKARVHAAFRAAKDHATCPGDAGSGAWCDFDI